MKFFGRSLLVQKAIREDRAYGPTVRELISPELVQVLREKQQMLEKEGFTKAQLRAILQMLENHQEEKVFYFLRHSPSELLSLDKKLRDEAVRNGKNLELPILSSMQVLEGSSLLL